MSGLLSVRTDAGHHLGPALSEGVYGAACKRSVPLETAPYAPSGSYAGQGGEGRSLAIVLTLGLHGLLLAILLVNWGWHVVSHEAPNLSVFDVAPPAAPPDPAPQPEPVNEVKPQPPASAKREKPKPLIEPAPIPIGPAMSAPEPQLVTMDDVPAPPREPAKPIPVPAAQAPSNAKPTWEGKVLAALNAVRRYPREAAFRRQQGVPWIRFVMDRAGKVLSVQLERSSGVNALDREALQLPKRAAPLPEPPADVAGKTIELVVPVEFFLRRS